ncbi:MAG: hypothetical protein QF664_03200 [Dehalococcoidia bacterium]|nr:hypothetical protein [Dehalococcoidia bacterium]
MRLLGVDPDGIERRAREHGATVVMPAADHAHGWREVAVRDPDGYEWNAGALLETGDPDGPGGAGG